MSPLPSTAAADEFVVRLALNRGWLRPEQVQAAEAALAAAGPARPAGLLARLAEQGVLAERQVAELLAAEFRLPLAPDLASTRIPKDALALVSRALAAKYRLIPLQRDGDRLRVAISDPLDTDAIDALRHEVPVPLDLVVAVPSEVTAAIVRCYGPDASAPLEELLDAVGEAAPPEEGSRTEATGSPERDADAPIIQLAHQIILQAIQRRASDIHLEPLEKRCRLRYRVDGGLLEVEGPPKRMQLAIVSRLKLMANISIAEKRVPQDGRIQIAVQGRPVDLRVSSLPTAHGESIVMRILDQEGLRLGLGELGFLADDAVTFDRMITLPDGLLLITGPTGSGKTTTLYSCLQRLNQTDRKIITVEDPVEFQLDGINQVPVRPDLGLTFAAALRSILRQAPNVIMVGEIRDRETAEIALHAALTGHMVFSTLHTNDAPRAVSRLVDLGIKPFLVSTALRAAMAQRLVRRICPRCRRPDMPGPVELRSVGIDAARAASATFARGDGCAYCNGTGYRGRMGIFEIFSINEELQGLIHEGSGTSALRQKARELGMRTMREDGVRKAIAGLTTITEVASITVGDAS